MMPRTKEDARVSLEILGLLTSSVGHTFAGMEQDRLRDLVARTLKLEAIRRDLVEAT
jgi:hypothetical protein